MKKRTPSPAPRSLAKTVAPPAKNSASLATVATAPLWLEGTLDALGFLAGTALGFGLGKLAGLQIFAEGYGTGTMVAIALVGIGGGLGLQAARHWRRRHLQEQQEQQERLNAQKVVDEK